MTVSARLTLARYGVGVWSEGMQAIKTGRWPGRPRPLPGESLSSWFGRVANANGLTPAELYRVAVPGGLHSDDLDRAACADFLFEVARRTEVDGSDLAARTLARWAGVIYGEDDGRCKLPWLPPAGTEKTRRSFGQQFCPACLQQDAIPHFRLEWRLSYVTICGVHFCLLSDRCHACGEPVNALKVERNRVGLSCHKCGAPLAQNVERFGGHTRGLAVQRRFDRVVRDGWACLPGHPPLYSLAFFQLASTLHRVLAGGKFARPLRDRLSSDESARREASLVPRVKEPERLPPRRRIQLLEMVVTLLDDWPDRFIAVCEDAGISQWHLLKRPMDVPFIFWEPVYRLLSDPVRTVPQDELMEGIGVLKRAGLPPTYGALVEVFGSKFVANRQLAEPSAVHEPWGRGRFWKLEGVDPAVRAAARKAAHQSGENVSAWVERALRNALFNGDESG